MVVLLLVTAAALLAAGSLIEIRAQSGMFRASTDSGYGAMASKLVAASNQTGGQLASLMAGAPQLSNSALPYTARGVLQQGLDAAVTSTSAEAGQAAALEPPIPTADAGPRFAAVMSDRASAALALRSTVDRLLGMTPLPIAGSPESPAPPAPAVLISPDQASTGMTAAGVLFQQADDQYDALRADLRANRVPIRLPSSVWVPAPVADAPLGPARLGASAVSLRASVALVALHQLIITAIGLEPTPVASGGRQTSIPGCTDPQSTSGNASPTVMPPTTSVQATVTVTNCGTVVEPVVRVTETLALADPPGTPPPPVAAAGGSSQVQAGLRSGTSAALSMKPLPVVSGHRYTLTLTIAIPASQDNPAGSTQQLLLQISG
ncbi:MAG: hypothetical protein ACRDYE_14800 [Acidimicrobiales bacterium]